MAWILRPSGGINEGTGTPLMDYVWDGNGTPTQSDLAQGYALANHAYQRDPSSMNFGGGLMSRLNPDGTMRVSQSGGLDSFLGGPGAFLLAAGGLGGGALSAVGGLGGVAGAANLAGGAVDPAAMGLDAGLMGQANALDAASGLGAAGVAGGASGVGGSTGALGGLGSVLGGAGGLGGLGGLLSNGALLGALAGGALGSQNGAKPAGTITTVQDVPDWLKPYVMGNLNAGVSAVNNAAQYSSLLPGAQRQLASTINGDYLNPNTNPALAPYLKDVAGQTGSYFTGMYGGPAGTNINNSGFQEALARGVTGALTGPALQAYNTERGNQLSAASSAPNFAGSASQATFGPLTSFGSLIPNATATSQPYFNNPTAGILGGALGGAVLGKGVFG